MRLVILWLALSLAGVAGCDPIRVEGDLDPEAQERLAAWMRHRVALLDRQLMGGRHATAPITVHLMSGSAPYRSRARAVLGQEPASAFGVYVAPRRAVVVDASAGTGWLMHELVHARLAEDLPAAAPWWDEGLASLLESAREEDGRLRASEDFRLAGLLLARDRGRLPSLARLVRMERRTFLGAGAAARVAAARYLCLWLDRRGQLERFHRLHRAGRAQDPGGAGALAALIGPPAELDRRFPAFLDGLSPALLLGGR